MCFDCWKQIDSFNHFHERVHVAQTNYLKQRIKCERENHFIEIPAVHLSVDATLTPDQIDGLHETNGLIHEPTIKLEYEPCKNAPLSPPLVSIEIPDQMNDIGIESDDEDDDDDDALGDDNSSYAQSEEEENESGRQCKRPFRLWVLLFSQHIVAIMFL